VSDAYTMRDETLYSAVCLGDGASGSLSFFAQPEGGKIPFSGLDDVVRGQHQLSYTKLTTNIGKIRVGPLQIRKIGLGTEQAVVSHVENDYYLDGYFFELILNGQRQVVGPASMFLGKRMLKVGIPVGLFDRLEVNISRVAGALKKPDKKAFLVWCHLHSTMGES